ncbi:MAG: CCA-adding enzyme [Chloroflexi bacterium]|nr:CCA-adding enzyme [Chloroflexota bacterium]
MSPLTPKLPPSFLPYQGRWIAHFGNCVVGQGGTPQQALWAAKNARHKETPQITYVPMQKKISFSPLFERVREILEHAPSVYLVGGAIRDTLLSIPVHDLDFVLSAETFPLARKVANRLEGAFFPLDEERETARVIVTNSQGNRQVLDFAGFRGQTLEDDLRARDFTINAMAVSLRDPQALLDPLSGAADLNSKLLRSCSEHTFQDDPLRILRAVRLAAQFSLHIDPQTRQQIPSAIPHLASVSPERQRDELFRILDGPKQATALKALDLLGAFTILFPHHGQFAKRTQRTLQHLEILFELLGEEHDPGAAASWAAGLAVLRLGRYREDLSRHLSVALVPERFLKPLLFLAATYTNLPAQNGGDTGDLSAGATLLVQRAESLRLSNAEIRHLRAAFRALERFRRLATIPHPPDRRAVYGYFRGVGEAGLSAVFLSLADFLAQHGSAPPKEAWTRYVDLARTLLEAWWEHHAERVSPPPLLNGTDLMESFHLSPGPIIGQLLETIREAQAAGEVSTRAEALALAQEHLAR